AWRMREECVESGGNPQQNASEASAFRRRSRQLTLGRKLIRMMFPQWNRFERGRPSEEDPFNRELDGARTSIEKRKHRTTSPLWGGRRASCALAQRRAGWGEGSWQRAKSI